jgi:hypothetical protein
MWTDNPAAQVLVGKFVTSKKGISESRHHVLQATIVPKRNCGQALSASLWTSFFSFVCGNGPFKMAHCTPKKEVELGRHLNV